VTRKNGWAKAMDRRLGTVLAREGRLGTVSDSELTRRWGVSRNVWRREALRVAV